MRSLTTALATALGAPVQMPAFLVELGFGTVQRYSSRATLSWGGNSWVGTPMDVDGLRVGPLRVEGTLSLDNRDGAIGTLVRAEGVQDRTIKLWGYDAAATATGDVVWLATAVGSAASIGETAVQINLRHRQEFTVSPRVTCSPEAGFGNMLPSGAVLNINGIELRLDRRG